MNVPANVPSGGGYHDAIVKLASDPNFNVEVLERMAKLQEDFLRAEALAIWNERHAACCAEMEPINAKMKNDQTKKYYANLFAVLDAIQPIYTKWGFSIRFDAEESQYPNKIIAVGYLSYGRLTIAHHLPMAIDNRGPQGRPMMNESQAHLAAMTYAKRGLLGMMFNLAVDDDKDGRYVKTPAEPQQQREAPPSVEPPHDPTTGEILGPHTHKRETLDGRPVEEGGELEQWWDWVRRLLAGIHTAKTEAQIDQWLELNKETLAQFKAENTPMFLKFEATTNRIRNEVKLATKEKEKSE